MSFINTLTTAQAASPYKNGMVYQSDAPWVDTETGGSHVPAVQCA